MRRDSTSSTATFPPLDYLQPSPVRGRLEPYDEVTKHSGCRFLQCTDTPNELKVLLPPRTTQVYALLLKAELVELEKQHDASWDRVLDIRRLKDRMIRKCQRLAKAYSANNPGTRALFLTLNAPPDFRVKEIEKWIRLQEGSDMLKKISPDTLRQRGSFCCDRCANLVPHHHTISGRRSSVQTAHSRRSSISERLQSKNATISRRPSMSASDAKNILPRPPSPSRSALISENSLQHVREQENRAEERTSLQMSSHIQENITSQTTSIVEEHAQARASKHMQSTSIDMSRFAEDKLQETRRSIHTIVEDPHEHSIEHSNRDSMESLSEVESLARLSIISPDPLPVPYHGSTSATFMEICDSPVDEAPRPVPNKSRPKELSAEDSTPSPPSEDDLTMDGSARLDAPRRRSSLKRNNSDLRMSMAYSTKTVSWAMDRDWTHQMTKYHAAAAEVEHADKEWGIICQKYQEELAGLKALRRNVSQTITKLRMEAEKLQREDEVVRDQEEKLRQGYEQLEQKHGQYRTKVNAVLQETEQVLTLCGTKRDGELQIS